MSIIMNSLNKKFEKVGLHIPEVMLPSKEINLSKWSVVACDQYTSQPEYWEEVQAFIDGSPSTLKMILPEVYLEEEDANERISKINSTMHQYLAEKAVLALEPCFIYIERKTSHADLRKGLISAVDLENYDYNKGSQSLIRATEGTVLERIPPRLEIRKNASLELPHIMLLIDDPKKSVIEPLTSKSDSFEKLYDFELMMNGGHIKGFKVSDEKVLQEIFEGLEDLSDNNKFKENYGVDSDKGLLLYAVGDGNHSLASAKAHWENVKKCLSEDEIYNHPSRYALVEIVNVHDEGITFEPIHRVIFNVKLDIMIDKMQTYFNSLPGVSCKLYKMYETKASMDKDLINLQNSDDLKHAHLLSFVAGEKYGIFLVENPQSNLVVGTLQAFLDELVKKDANIKIDYIHGDDVVTELGSEIGNIGFYLPPMDKKDLFKTVILDGALPRKTFSMGEAEEKRFYLESRKIVK